MDEGLRAEIKIPVADNCIVAEISEEDQVDVAVESRLSGLEGRVIEELRIPEDEQLTSELSESHTVYKHETSGIYRTERESDIDCVCGIIERLGQPIADTRARNGNLFLTMYLTDKEILRSVIAELRATGREVELHSLSISVERESAMHDPSVVDTGKLTTKQQNALERAVKMGYFDTDSQVNATDVAESLEITRSTFSHHLNSALSKVLDDIV
jgi:predicted DNA binding protein